MAAKRTTDEALPDREAARHKGWLVKAQVLFKGTDGETHLVDELPRVAVKSGTMRLGQRRLKKGPIGADGKPKMTPVTPQEAPVILDRELIPAEQAAEFHALGALEPHYA